MIKSTINLCHNSQKLQNLAWNAKLTSSISLMNCFHIDWSPSYGSWSEETSYSDIFWLVSMWPSIYLRYLVPETKRILFRGDEGSLSESVFLKELLSGRTFIFSGPRLIQLMKPRIVSGTIESLLQCVIGLSQVFQFETFKPVSHVPVYIWDDQSDNKTEK